MAQSHRDLSGNVNLSANSCCCRFFSFISSIPITSSTNMHRTLTILLCLATLLPAAPAQQGATVAEQYLLQLTNQHRAEQGLAPLTWDPALARAARAHAQRISREPGPAEHQYSGEPDLL